MITTLFPNLNDGYKNFGRFNMQAAGVGVGEAREMLCDHHIISQRRIGI